jgi:hypothetical protein
MKSNVERIAKCQPAWFDALVDGQEVFGRGRDKLVLEIIGMGGLWHLKKMGNLKVSKTAEPRLDMSLRELEALKSSLEVAARLPDSVIESVRDALRRALASKGPAVIDVSLHESES